MKQAQFFPVPILCHRRRFPSTYGALSKSIYLVRSNLTSLASVLGENVSKIAEITEGVRKSVKSWQTQLQISRNNLEAAKEQKEAKLLQAYNLLLAQNTSELSQEAKA